MVKSPPITTHLASGLVAMAQTAPLSFGAKVVGAPVVRLKAATYVRAASPWPAGLPGCRIRVNRPPAYTVFPAIARAFTLELVCHEGCLIADTAEANPAVAASTGGPEGISAAASTAAAVTTARTSFFINFLRLGEGGAVSRRNLTLVGDQQEAGLPPAL